MKALVFGMGNIGRGFLGSLLSESGFATTFVDIDAIKVEQMNAACEYPVYIASSSGFRETVVHGVSAVTFTHREAVLASIVEADVILTAVGKNALTHVAGLLAEGLVLRLRRRPKTELHVVVVACENVQDNTSYLCDLMLPHIEEQDRSKILDSMSFPNCVVDRIVPNVLPDDLAKSPLSVAVEEYFQLAIDADGLRGPLPSIAGIEISQNLDATLEQKLFTLNMAHAVLGYFGYLGGYTFVHEAMEDGNIQQLLDGAAAEVTELLVHRHPSIVRESQLAYVHKVWRRFRNPFLRDEITRVARQPRRKLGPQDRLVRPAMLSCEMGQTPSFLSSGITAALHFDYHQDGEAHQLVQELRERGIDRVLCEVSKIEPQSPLGNLVKSQYLLRAL